MRLRLKRTICIALSGLCILFGTGVCCIICNHPGEQTENAISSFYREPVGSLDVMVIGASAAAADYYPSVAWKQEGITSYCLTVIAIGGNVYKSMLREVLCTQPQAVILLDTDGFTTHNHILEIEDPIRMWVDCIPWSERKTDAIKELLPDTMPERIFPFSRYHRNMTSLYAYIPITVRLLKKQIFSIRDPMKGAGYEDGTTNKPLYFLNTSNLSPQALDTLPQKALNEFLAFCQQEGLKRIVFVEFPKAYFDDDTLERNRTEGARIHQIRRQVQEYGYEVYSYNELDNPAKIDPQTDFLDSLHLNKKGAEKFSAYFAEYLQEKYAFPPKSEELTAQWDADVSGLTD